MAENHVLQLSSDRLGNEETEEDSEVEICSEEMLDGLWEVWLSALSGGDAAVTTGEDEAVILMVESESVESSLILSLCSEYGVWGGLW